MAQTVRGVVARKKGEPVEVVDVLIPEPGPREVVVDDKVARAFVQIAELNDSPLHLLLGSDAVDLAAAALQKTTEEDQQWAQLGRSVDFDAR
jgi:hypothetical protein